MAARCTHYLKPLLEAGTKGTLGSACVFIPHVTEDYRAPASAAASEDASYPVCTVRHFPSTTEHTLQVRRTPETPTHLAQSSAADPFANRHLMVPPSPHSGPGMSLKDFSICLPRPSTATNSKTANKGEWEPRLPNTKRLRA